MAEPRCTDAVATHRWRFDDHGPRTRFWCVDCERAAWPVDVDWDAVARLVGLRPPSTVEEGKSARKQRNLVCRIAGRDGYWCRFCERSFVPGFRVPTIEHLVPLCRGGANSDFNRGLACSRCNQAKGALTEAEYRDGLESPPGLRGAHKKRILADVDLGAALTRAERQDRRLRARIAVDDEGRAVDRDALEAHRAAAERAERKARLRQAGQCVPGDAWNGNHDWMETSRGNILCARCTWLPDEDAQYRLSRSLFNQPA